MPTRTIFLAIIIAITTILLVFLASREQPQQPSSTTLSPTPTRLQKTSTVYFLSANLPLTSPPLNSIDVDLDSEATLNVMVDTGNYSITGVQLEMQYDPSFLTNMTIKVPEDSFFGKKDEYFLLFNEVDKKNGRISFAIAISPSSQSKIGVGKVATISFTPKKAPIESGSTITFIDDTLVTREGITESVLIRAIPISMSLSP